MENNINNNLSMEEFFDNLSESWDKNEKSSQDELRSFLSFLDIKNGEKVLDLGCGTGIITNLLFEKSNEKVIGMDLSSKMIQKAKEKHTNNKSLSFINANFLEYNFDSKFDYIVIFNAYPHFVDREKFKISILKALKTNGKLAIIHNFSRKELEICHSNCPNQFSRSIEESLQEFEIYKPELNLIYFKEDEHSYKAILKRN